MTFLTMNDRILMTYNTETSVVIKPSKIVGKELYIRHEGAFYLESSYHVEAPYFELISRRATRKLAP